MDKSERLTSISLRNLLNTEGPCVTIVLAGNENGGTATELKTALNQLRKKAGNEPKMAAVLKSIESAGIETASKRSIAILACPSFVKTLPVGRNVKTTATSGARFDARTLLQAANHQKTFYILALSQNRTRLLHCTEISSEEVEIPGVPLNLTESMDIRQPDHVLDNRISGGPSIGAGKVMFGTSSDKDAKDQYLLHFFTDIEKAVTKLLSASGEPLIAAGVESELALYNRANTYAKLVLPGIHGAPDGLEGGEMHRRALELLDTTETKSGNSVPADFDKRVGTGHASVRAQEIVAAAQEGRVSHLFLQPDASYMGSFDPVRNRVKHAGEASDSSADLIEIAIESTILKGGEVRILPASAMPNGVPVCALMRYPATQQTATNPATAA